MKLSPNEIIWLVDNVGKWTGTDTVSGLPNRIIATAVCIAESGGDTEIIARSSTGSHIGNRDHGLFQISNKFHGEKLKDWRDPVANVLAAKKIWTDAGGWKPWAVYNSGSYTQYLPDANIAAANPIPPPNARFK